MTSNKPQPNQQSKPIHINLDAFPEDNNLLTTIQSEQRLTSKKEALHVLCNSYRGEEQQESTQLQCTFLCGEYCSKNGEKIHKVDLNFCRACQNSQRITKEETAQFTAYATRQLNRWTVVSEIASKIGIQRGAFNINLESDCLSAINQLLDKRLSEMASLEIDNAFLREQLTTMQKDPLAEKNAWLTVELSNKEEENKRLKMENEQKDKVINAYMFQQQGMKK